MTSLPVPLTQQLRYQVQPGSHIQVTGVEPRSSQGFVVNLLAANNERVLHISVRHSQQEKVVVLNSERGGQWLGEERGDTFPLHHEAPFKLLVVTTPLHYAVLGNGELIAEYKHRVQPSTIRYVNVEGDVQVTGVFEASGVRLKKHGYKLALRTEPLDWTGPARVARVPGGLKLGEDILIAAKPVTGEGFTVNLRAGNDIVLHFNPRFFPGDVVRNASVNGVWGEPETGGEQPFHQGKDFNLQITAKKDRLVAYVNGVKHSVFKHRHGELQAIESIETAGLDLYQVQVV